MIRRVKLVDIYKKGRQNKINAEIEELEHNKCKIINVSIGGEYGTLYASILYEVRK